MPALVIRTPWNKHFIEENSAYQPTVYLHESRTTSVQRQIRRAGLRSYEPEVQAAIYAAVEAQSDYVSFYDVGSHIGLYSILVSVIFRSMNPYVAAFEPSPGTYAINSAIRSANKLNYSLFQQAVSNKIGEIDFFLSPTTESSNSLNPRFRDGSEKTTVAVTTLDHHTLKGAPGPSVVKIDVETLEYAVLIGGFETIVRCRPVIFCELLLKSPRDYTRAAIGMLDSINYSFYRLTADGPPEPVAGGEVMDKLSGVNRDWIFTPEPLSDRYMLCLARWTEALSCCDVSGNALIPRGGPVFVPADL